MRSVKQLSLFAALLAFTLPAAKAQPGKNYQGLLWEISKPGVTKKSYLYGTMHVARKISFNLSDSFYIALENSDVVGLESAPSEWLDNSLHPAYLSFYFGRYPTFISNRNFYQRFFEFAPPDNKTLKTELKTKNGLANGILYRSNEASKDYEEDTYLDMFIFMSALKLHKPVASLEEHARTNQLRLEADIRNRQDKKERQNKKIPKWLEDMAKDKGRTAILEDAYREGNLDLIEELNQIGNTERYNRHFLHYRNQMHADGIDSIIAKGQSVFAGVGAAHLPGTEGVIEMLRRKGYTVRAVTFTQTDIAKTKKEQFETAITEVKLERRASPDNSFSVLLPGKLYEFYNSGGSRKFFSADFTNGGNFLASRISTHNFITQLNPENYMVKIDSMLFENIPGTIKEKKKITKNGFTGWEIFNTTKTGDQQRYQIFFTPLEIFIFKYSGKKEYIKKWGDDIFNSLEIAHPASAWKKYTYYNNEFTIEMPAYSSFNNDSFNALYEQPTAVAYDESKKEYYFFIKAIYNDLSYLEEDKFELEHIAEKFCKRHFFELKSSKFTKHGKLPAVEFTGKNGKVSLSGLVVLNEGRYYFLGTTTADKSNASKFFKSFTLSEARLVSPLHNYTDTSMLFSVRTDTVLNMIFKYQNAHDIYDRYTEKNKTGNFDYSFDAITFTSQNKDVVRLSYRRFNPYEFYDSPEALFNDIYERKFELDRIITANKKIGTENGLNVMTLEMRDTNTIRTLRMKFILNKNNDAIYVLKSLGDTLTPPPPFINTFYSTFTPKDTVTGTSVFTNKAPKLLEDIASSDTLVSRIAKQELVNLEMGRADVMPVINFLNTYKFSEKEEYLRFDIYGALASVKSDTILELGQKLYKENPDYYPLQWMGLRMIAEQMNEKSTLVFKEIMFRDRPVLRSAFGNYDEYQDAFHYYDDSLALLLKFFPERLKDMENENWRHGVMVDLLEFMDSGLIKREFYEQQLPIIMEEVKSNIRYMKADQQYSTINTKRDAAKLKTYSSNDIASFSSHMSTELQWISLLLHYYDRPEIKKLIDESEPYLGNNSLLNFYGRKVKFDSTYDKARIDSMAADPSIILGLYLRLKEINRVSMIPPKYLNHETLLFAAAKNKGEYSFRKLDFKKVKPEFIKTEVIDAENHKIKLHYYLYDHSKEEDDNDNDYYEKRKLTLFCVAFIDDDKELLPVDPKYVETESIEDRDRIEEKIKDMTNAIKLRKRQRAAEEDAPLKPRSFGFDDF